MLLEAIARHALQTPARPAYQNRTQTLTYGRLWRAARALAARLRAGTGPVLICGEKETGMPVCFLGCLMAGRPWLPVDPQQPAERLLKIRRLSGAADVLCCGSHPAAAVLGAVQAEPLFGAEKLLDPARFAANPDRDAYWMFTSGSTGAPKGVRIPLSALENFVEWMLGLPAVAACGAGVSVNQARFSFDLSVADLWPTFAAGGTVRALETAEQGDLPALYEALGRSGARRLVCTPSFARLCLCDAAFCKDLLPHLETVFFCGETLAPRTVRTLEKRFEGLRILNAYGPTEAACAVAAVEVQGREGTLPVGRVADAASRLLILDEQGEPRPEGMPGEIAIAGPSVGSGYIGGEAGGFGRFNGEKLYRTGDEGVIRDGFLWHLGRRDRQIKYKGYRIEPGEVEAAILAWDEVRAVVVLPLRAGGEVRGLAAAVEWEKNPPDPAECSARLRRTLPEYMLPRRWRAVERMPVNERGKCDFAALERMLEDE